jgi:signal transduction histidine kinase
VRRCGRADVVRRLLDFARQSESTRARASLNEVVEDVVALSKHLIHTSGVELKLDLEVEDLPWVLVDANQMKQVLLNLVHNALQAMPNGGEMKILTETVARNNRDWVIVSVHGYRRWHLQGGSGAHLRTILHDQGKSGWNRSGSSL